MTTYGTTPVGFVRKPLADILADIEEKAAVVFGAGVIQTPESPLGQLNGLMASILTTAWEIAEATYQSYDPDQAEGARLEQLGRIRLLERISGEQDSDYRQAITNDGRARIDLADIERAVKNVDGVTWAKVFVNETGEIDANGLEPHSISVAVIGGDDVEVATVIRAYIVPGVSSYGNTIANVVIDGYCRPVSFVRPVALRTSLYVQIRRTSDRLGCPPPATGTLKSTIASQFAGAMRLANGEPMTLHGIRLAASCTFPNIEILAAYAGLPPSTDALTLPFRPHFFEMLTVGVGDISIEVVP